MTLSPIGSISEVKEACDIQYSPAKLQQGQVQPQRVEDLLTFKKEITEQLDLSDNIQISDIAATADDTLFLCNNFYSVRKIYVYKTNLHCLTYHSTLNLPSDPYGIAIFKGTHKAVVTFPYQSYVQFFNTKHLNLDKTIEVGSDCYGITTTGDNIVVGKINEIKIFEQSGKNLMNILLNDFSSYVIRTLHYNILYNQNDDRIVYENSGQICSVQLDGTVLYRYALPGNTGLAVDKQGHVYVSECNKGEIHRLLPDGRFCDMMLTRKDGIEKTCTIAFNESYTKFYVTNRIGLVQVYYCN